MEQSDVVIVGAGVIGLSTGFHLLLRDPRLRVTVVELAMQAGSGSTAKATGGIRHQWDREVLVRLSQRSLIEYQSFRELTGVDVEFEAIGYLLFASTSKGQRRLEQTVRVQRELGVEVEEVMGEELHHRCPYLRTDDIRVASFTAADGHANPYAAVTGYLQAFRRLGGQVLLGEEARAVHTKRGRVASVETNHRSIATPTVVAAAGVRARQVTEMVGVSVPVFPFRRQIAVLTSVRLSDKPVPFTMDVDSGWYIHCQTDGAILLGGTDKDTHPGTEEVVDPAVISQFIEMGVDRIPRLADASFLRAYAGLRALTMDDLPVLGPLAGVPGFFCACGLAGHGFMHAPAVGDALAQWILRGEVDLPGLEACSPERFDLVDSRR